MRIVTFVLYYLLGILGIIAVSNAPILFSAPSESFIDVSSYITNTVYLVIDFVQPGKWTYTFQGQSLSIVSFLWDPYLYSMKLLIGAIFLGIFVSLALAILTMFLPQPLINTVKRSLGLIEAVPDIMVAFLLQLSIVYIFTKTDVLLMKFVTLGDQRIYLAPMLILSFLPIISLYRIIVLLIEEELTKHYVELALSKGIKYNTLIINHVLRNIAKSVFNHSKIIIWALLSSLFVIEYMFNINGISSFILDDFRPMVIAVALLMIFTPLFIIYQGVEVFIFKQDYQSTIVRNKKTRNNSKWKTTINKSIVLLNSTKYHLNAAYQFKRVFKRVWVNRNNKKINWSIWNWITRAIKEILIHFKNPKFLFGFLVIFIMVVYSIIHSIIREIPVEQFVLIYNDEGKLLSSKPHPPSEYVMLGTDRQGFSILDQLLAGAKYTILFASLIALLRMILGFILAIPFAMFVKSSFQKAIEKFVDSMHFLPLSIIAIILLTPILTGTTSGFKYSFFERILMETIILTILVVPLVTVLIGNEIKLIMEKEFIVGAKVLGGNNKHILMKHIMPHLGSKLGIIFGQQFIQVLLLLIHLGLFNLFLGGTSIMYNISYKAPPHSVTNEWAGLISSTREAMQTGHYWIIVPVFVAFIIVIISMQLIVEGIQEVQQERVGVAVKKGKKTRKLFKFNTHKQRESISSRIQVDNFNFVKQKDQSK